jgi:chromosome segregation ATPase
MLLTVGPFLEFAQFLQIMSWIILPVFALAVTVTIFIHYRRKKRNNGDDQPEDIFSSMNEPAAIKRDTYMLFDHSGLIRQYRNKLSYNHARYTALKHDYEKLELKYAAINAGTGRFIHLKKNHMENTQGQSQQTIDKITEDFATEKNQLINRLDQLNRSYKSLESENESLLEQINMQAATGEEKAIIVNQWKEESYQLKNQLKEQEYFKDVIVEKKAQVEFLQNQLDQRIRNYHQAEQLSNEMQAELEQSRQRSEQISGELRVLKNELEKKDELVAGEKLLLDSKTNQVTYLENMIKELKEQNEILNAAVADNQDKMHSLQQELEDERCKTSSMEQKLLANKQLLQRLYKEFMSCIEDENDELRVIPMKQAISY